MREETRNRIVLFSFVLTVFVIWLHAGESLISSIPGQIAVPGFFILSGFLFYRGIGDGVNSATGSATGTFPFAETSGTFLQKETSPLQNPLQMQKETSPLQNGFFPVWMRQKLLRRIHTLLIPYLTWNAIYYVIYLIAGKTTLAELPQAVLCYSCNPVFWYLFQLNLITAISPLLYYIMKRKITAVIWLAVIFALAVFYGPIHSVIPYILINEDALFYYSAGAFLALYVARPGTDGAPPEESRKLIGISAGVCGGVLLLCTAMRYLLPGVVINIGVIGQRLSGALLVWFLLGFLKKIRIFPWMRITFFVYATHYMVIRAVWRAEIALGLNENQTANIITYLIMPAVCIAAAYGVYIIMKKFVPKVLDFLTGGRGGNGYVDR